MSNVHLLISCILRGTSLFDGSLSPDLLILLSAITLSLNPIMVASIRGQHSFSGKGQTVNILSFAGHAASVLAAQLLLWQHKRSRRQYARK